MLKSESMIKKLLKRSQKNDEFTEELAKFLKSPNPNLEEILAQAQKIFKEYDQARNERNFLLAVMSEGICPEKKILIKGDLSLTIIYGKLQRFIVTSFQGGERNTQVKEGDPLEFIRNLEQKGFK